jgi:hypothetical protein
MTCRVKVRVVPDPNGWRIVVCIGRYCLESETTIFARERDAVKAATKIARAIGTEDVSLR